MSSPSPYALHTAHKYTYAARTAQSFEEGATVAITAFLDVVCAEAKRKKLKVYIHPVVPVLNETRYVLM